MLKNWDGKIQNLNVERRINKKAWIEMYFWIPSLLVICTA